MYVNDIQLLWLWTYFPHEIYNHFLYNGLGNQDGTIGGVEPNSAVSCQLLKEIHDWKLEEASTVDIITRLRRRTTSPVYTSHE